MIQSAQMKKATLIILYSIFLLINLSVVIPKMGSFSLGILRSINREGLWRSARFAQSSNFADYIEFLNDQIPMGGIVIIPPEEVSTWALADPPTMQFFLAPRTIINCREIECGNNFINQENTYILVMGRARFPGSNILDQEKNIRMHNDTWGVYGPDEGLGTGGFISEPIGIVPKLFGITSQFVFISLMLVLGYYFATLIVPWFSPWFRFGIGIGLVLGCYSILGYLILLSGWYVRIKAILFGITAVLVLIILISFLRKQLSLDQIKDLFRHDLISDPWLILIILFGGVMVFIAIGSGFHQTDSFVLWGPKAIGLIVEGLGGVVTRGTNTTTYPLHIPFLLAMLMDAFGNSLPIAKVIFPIFYLSTLLIGYEFLKSRIEGFFAGLSIIVFATIPEVVGHAIIGYANLPLTYYLLGAVILLAIATKEAPLNSGRLVLIMAGLFLALATWTRPEGFYLVAGILLIWILSSLSSKKYRVMDLIWPTLLPIFLVIFWKITSVRFYFGSSDIESTFSTFLTGLLNGKFELKNIYVIGNYLKTEFLNFQSWGVLGVSLILAVLLLLLRRIVVTREALQIVLVSISQILIICGIYFILPYGKQPDIDWWIRTGFNRMLLPGISILWVGLSIFLNSTATTEESKLI